MKTTEQNKQTILEYINSDLLEAKELIQLFSDIIDLKNGHTTKNDLLKFAGYTNDQCRKVDSAYPQPYADSIREIYPDFNNGIHCFDYNNMSFGEMVNISNLIATRVIKQF
jgi:hypothetical protein